MSRRLPTVAELLVALPILFAFQYPPPTAPVMSCTPEVVDVGEEVRCVAGPFDAAAPARITVIVDGQSSSTSTRLVDSRGQVVKVYTPGEAVIGKAVIVVVETIADGAHVRVFAQYRVRTGTGETPAAIPPEDVPTENLAGPPAPDEVSPTMPDTENTPPSTPTGSASPSPSASAAPGDGVEPLTIVVVGGVAVALSLALAAAWREGRS